MARVTTIGSLVPRGDGRTVKPEPKRVDPHYTSDAHKSWRDEVVRRAGARCERIDNGVRCTKAAPQHRMFANHVIERRDGGNPYDPANGECLCGSHHTKFTMQQRAKRSRG